MNMKDLIPPGDPPPQLALLRTVRSIMLERRLRHQDGHLIDVEISASMLWRGRALQSIVRDITQHPSAPRKRCEAVQRRRANRRQRADHRCERRHRVRRPAFKYSTGYTA